MSTNLSEIQTFPDPNFDVALPTPINDGVGSELTQLDQAIKDALKDLSERQRKFAQTYSSSGNATKAAIAAGYSERTARTIANENMTKPAIRKSIKLLGYRHQLRTGISAEWKRRALIEIYLKSMEQDPPDTSGASRAIDLLNKMDGAYAPIKIDVDTGLLARLERAHQRVLNRESTQPLLAARQSKLEHL